MFSNFVRSLKGVGAACLLTVSGVALGADINIGVVNIARLLEDAPQARAAMQSLQDEFAPRQREIVAKQKELREQEEAFQRDAAVMGEAERRSSEKSLRDSQRELARRQNEYLEDLNLRRNEELGRLQRSLLQEVQNYARSANYDLIVGDSVLFASEAVDITSAVLAGLESRFQAENATSQKSDN